MSVEKIKNDFVHTGFFFREAKIAIANKWTVPVRDKRYPIFGGRRGFQRFYLTSIDISSYREPTK